MQRNGARACSGRNLPPAPARRCAAAVASAPAALPQSSFARPWRGEIRCRGVTYLQTHSVSPVLGKKGSPRPARVRRQCFSSDFPAAGCPIPALADCFLHQVPSWVCSASRHKPQPPQGFTLPLSGLGCFPHKRHTSRACLFQTLTLF